ncbi:lysophospholipid acyltransferase LPEAT2 isoform X2 [Magnolia sinica]|uniref:lysophospholipid acyltransferase LPEAT2 isoform X2 n=1 Tax=Magnolia sinica TaxID=86752 RepID=UPI0026591CEF|nr:lysophospholipid acyltransferase LPEAT2 isoform X2 [Magnolia sinica]
MAAVADPRNDLNTPLLSTEPQFVLEIESNGSDHDDPNPFEFIGARPLSFPRPHPIDPFRNHTPSINGFYEFLKIVICIPVALVRLTLFGLSLLVGFLATKLALYGWKDKHNPMPKWRCRLMWVTRICSRCILFCFGYHWIKRVGRPASRETAPIVVCNHVSYIEPIFFFYELFPTIVASESHDAIPFVGTIIRAMQVIYVNRFSAPSRKHAVHEIKRKASCDGFPRLLLFPEGTTTNGRVLISFQLGAFIPGFPIQPVVVRYPHVHFDQSWGNIHLMKLMFRMFTQFHNFMEVEYLPVIAPLDNKKENAGHFAERYNASSYMVEMAWVDSTFNISTLEAMEFLDKFLAMNPNSSGRVKIHDFSRSLRLGLCPLSEKIFAFIDVEKLGSITFRQFLLGSAHIMKQPLFQQACTAAFNCCDDEGKGYITKQQLGDAIHSAMPSMNDNNVSELFNLFDSDNDGAISYDDFMACLRRNPLLVALFASNSMHCGLIEGGKLVIA